MGQSHHKPLVWGKWPTFQSQYVLWLRKSPTCKSLESGRSIIRCLSFSLFFLMNLLWQGEMEVGGLLAGPCTTVLVFSHIAIGLRAAHMVCYIKEEAEGISMDNLNSYRILSIKIRVNFFIYLRSYSFKNEYVGKICYQEKKKKRQKIKDKSKKLDSTFRSTADKVRGCPGTVHRLKHSPQRLKALQDAARSDTTRKKCQTHRNWSPHL